ncbi:hypothetical protein NIES2119_31835 [[Phormidium ambiguum] IAM M-71]|uniref:Uncharacterized protein n=1 Tax=[Phormidium ambiguum] IAM M-71 TaxID=454136 RepID=A0A1U7I1M8_9CYAN|nr:tetratricopeptide repeat protein [Phormidium ambiguum]OKH29878.1 hypothetical protein NIES2119_31835 [Phormidium ambiguum IAM M-71]
MTNNFAEVDVKIKQIIESLDLAAGGELAPVDISLDLTIGESSEIYLEDIHNGALKWWLVEYQPEPDASNIEKVQGYLEAVYHLCESGAWIKAREIPFFVPFNSPTGDPLHQLLNTWGYYSDQDSLYQQILDSDKDLPLDLKVIFLNGRGDAKFDMKQDEEAYECYELALSIARKIHNKQQEGMALRGLGKVCWAQKDYKNSIYYFSSHLKLAKEINNTQQIGIALQNIGNVYRCLNQHEKALEYYRNSYEICNTTDDLRGKAKTILSFGKSYSFKSQYDTAILYFCESLEIFRNIEDPIGKREASFLLGSSYQQLGKLKEAKDCYEQSLKITQEPREYEMEANTIFELGWVCFYLEEFKQAAECYKKFLNIANNFLLQLQGDAMSQLGLIFNKLKEFDTSIRYSQDALKWFQKTGHKVGEGYALGNIGVSLRELDKYNDAIEYFKKAIEIDDNLSDVFNKGVILRDLGITYRKMKMYQASIDYLYQSMEILNQYKQRVDYDKEFQETLNELELTKKGAETLPCTLRI